MLRQLKILSLSLLIAFSLVFCNYGFEPDTNVHGAMIEWNCEPESSAKLIYDLTEEAEGCLGFSFPEVNVRFVENATEHCWTTVDVAGCLWNESMVIAECGVPEVIPHERLHDYLCKTYTIDCDTAHTSPLWACVNF